MKLLKSTDWEYLNEGNQNIILFYSGDNPLFIQKAMRL